MLLSSPKHFQTTEIHQQGCRKEKCFLIRYILTNILWYSTSNVLLFECSSYYFSSFQVIWNPEGSNPSHSRSCAILLYPFHSSIFLDILASPPMEHYRIPKLELTNIVSVLLYAHYIQAAHREVSKQQVNELQHFWFKRLGTVSLLNIRRKAKKIYEFLDPFSYC